MPIYLTADLRALSKGKRYGGRSALAFELSSHEEVNIPQKLDFETVCSPKPTKFLCASDETKYFESEISC